MVRLLRLFDVEKIKTILSIDSIYRELLGDTALKLYTPDTRVTSWFLISDEETPVGLIIFRDFSHNLLSLHFGIFKEFRNKKTKEYLIESLDIIRKQTGCKYIAAIQASNIKAVKLASSIGLKHINTIKDSHDNDSLVIFSEV